jgi:CelD/BcsL family acetyltransferase involved in cellulose biosynthesis
LLQADPQHRHDVILLDKMPETIGGLRNPFMDLAPTLNPSGAYATTLAGDWEAFYAARRSSSSRKRDRSKRKKLAENGNVRMVTPVEPAAADRTLMLLMDQKQRAFARMGVANMFRNPGYREFFTDLTTNPQLAGLTHVSQLEVGETIAATNLGLVFRGAYYHVLTSYDDGPISRFGPGATHLQEIMRYALERGCTLFDFTIGDEPYKRDWSDRELALYDHVAAATWRGALSAGSLAIGRRAKRAIKQSERLWPVVVRLRATLGALRTRIRKTGAPERRAD